MSEEAGWIMLLGLAAVLLVVINDWWKRRLVEGADARQTAPARHWLQNRTDWLLVTVLVIGFVAFAIVRSNPAWTNNYSGPGSVLLHHFFPVR